MDTRRVCLAIWIATARSEDFRTGGRKMAHQRGLLHRFRYCLRILGCRPRCAWSAILPAAFQWRGSGTIPPPANPPGDGRLRGAGLLRRILRRACIPRVFATTVLCLDWKLGRGSRAAGDCVRRGACISGFEGSTGDLGVRCDVRNPSGVAQEPASGNDSARRARHSFRPGGSLRIEGRSPSVHAEILTPYGSALSLKTMVTKCATESFPASNPVLEPASSQTRPAWGTIRESPLAITLTMPSRPPTSMLRRVSAGLMVAPGATSQP